MKKVAIIFVFLILLSSMAAFVNLGKTAALPGRFSIIPMFTAKPPRYTVSPPNVAFGDADWLFALVVFGALEKHTENVTVNGAYNPSEGIYRDVDNSGAVSIGDIRLNTITGYAAGTTVAAGNSDIGGALVAFAANEKHMENIAVGDYNPAEYIYRDADNSFTVNNNDVRLTAVGHLTIDFRVDYVLNLNTFSSTIYWDPSVLAIPTTGGTTEGPFMASGGGSTLFPVTIDNAAGRVTVGGAIVGGLSVSGGGVVATVTFLVKKVGATGFRGGVTQLIDPAFVEMPSEWKVIDAFVLATVAYYWGTSNAAGDLNKDGTVNALDLALMAMFYGNAGLASTSP